MRLSCLVIAAILLVSATLFAQHTSGTSSSSSSSAGSFSGSSGSGASHGSYSDGSSSSARPVSSHNSSSSASHVASTGTAASHSSPSAKSPSTRQNAAPERKSFRSFLRHPFRKTKPVQRAEFRRPVPCLKAPCAVCPPGESSNGKGGCVSSVVESNACQPGQFGNGFACGTQFWFNDCRALADELAAQQRQMGGQVDAGQSLRYQLLKEQYDRCLERYRFYPFSAALLDTP
jgi:hypothetical protein